MFGEKTEEWSTKQGKNVLVWHSPKYQESRAKAVEIIKDGKFGLSEADFWILMNETKSGKMAYTGLIISHNGCLKINDVLTEKFRPECVTCDKAGYNGSLVYTYCCPGQGLFEVGEVNPRNCKIEYPYAMALKRLQDRVILKLSRLAYAGIYSEAEADEFAHRDEPEEGEQKPAVKDPVRNPCSSCGKEIVTVFGEDGKVRFTAAQIINRSVEAFGRPMCYECSIKESEVRKVLKSAQDKATAAKGNV